MSDTRVKLIIEAATDKAKQQVKGFTDSTAKGFEKAEQSAKKFTTGMKNTWNSAKAAWVEIGAAGLALKKAYDLANRAAQFQDRERAFANMAASHGASADKIVADIKRISKGTIDTMTIMEKAGTAMTLGIQADKLDELMEIARSSSKITGQTVSEAFSDITLAVGRQSKMILDNLGIIVKVEDANERYAQKLGKTADELSDVDKKQAFLNATLEAGGDIVARVGEQQDSAAERMQRYQARWKNAAVVIGRVFLNVAQGIELIFAAAGASVNRSIAAYSSVMSKMMEKASWIPGVGKHLEKWAEGFEAVEENSKAAADKGIKHMSETWDTMTGLWKKSEPVRSKVTQDLADQGKAAKEAAGEVKKLMDLHKSDAEKRQAAIEEMYSEAGINADGYFREQVNELTKQGKEWKDAGVNIEDVNAYMFARIEKMQEEAFSKGADAQADWLSQLKWHASSLITDLEEKEQQAMERFAAIGQGIADLDGSQIGVHVQLYDNDFVSGIDQLISKLGQLQSASTSSSVSGAGASSSGSSSGSGQGSATVYQSDKVTTININQAVSRSDVDNIIAEQDRQENRG